MSYFFNPAARIEYLEHVAYYESRQPGLGARYLAAFDAAMVKVCDAPHRYAELDDESFAKLREWFIEFDQARWDKQLEADSNAGKLDSLINSALAEHQAGKTRDL